MLPFTMPEADLSAARAAAEARAAQLWDDVDPDWEARNAHIRQRWAYYEGRHPRPLEVDADQPDDNTILNLARPIIDRGVAFLFGRMPRIQLDETAEADTALEAVVRDVWAASGGAELLQEIAQNGGMSGAGAVKIIPTPEGPHPCRVVNLDPATIRMAYAPGDVSDILGYRIQFKGDGKRHHRQDITRDAGPGSPWTITDWEGEETLTGAITWRMVEVTPWAYALPPIVWCKNYTRANVAWGYSDLEDAALNNAINAVVSSSRKTLRQFADPQTVSIGANAEGWQRGGDNIWWTESADAEIKNIEMQSDLTAARSFYLDLRAAAMMIAAIPDVALIGDKLGAVTNFGLRVLYATMIERNEVKRTLYGGLISRVNATIAQLASAPAPATTLTWPDPLPRDELAHATTIEAKRRTGLVSDETLTGELGYSYADEQARLTRERTERERAAPAATPAQAGVNGTAVQLAQQAAARANGRAQG